MLRTFWDKFWHDSHGHIGILQWPNGPLWVWIICAAAGMFIKTGPLGHLLSYLGGAALFVWAYLEITSGVSYFRRTLGAVIMATMIISHIT